jgi:proteic killer suppression protein
VVNYLNAGRLLSASLTAGKANTGWREMISLQLLPESHCHEARASLVGARGLQAVTIWVTIVGMAILDFRHKGLERYFTAGSLAGIQRKHASRLRLILGRLNVAERPGDMDLPGLGLHQLRGGRKGTWAVKVSGNWRVTFLFSGKDVERVNYEDYH